MSEFVHRLRVRYHECDPSGIVFNANFIVYADVAIVEMLAEKLGSSEDTFDAFNIDMVVGSLTLDFKATCRPGDDLDVGIEVTSVGTTSINFGIHMRRDTTTVAQGSLRWVCIDRDTLAKKAVPEELREALLAI